jgi:hypothetical protein
MHATSLHNVTYFQFWGDQIWDGMVTQHLVLLITYSYPAIFSAIILGLGFQEVVIARGFLFEKYSFCRTMLRTSKMRAFLPALVPLVASVLSTAIPAPNVEVTVNKHFAITVQPAD